jgi:hypothetical protein
MVAGWLVNRGRHCDWDHPATSAGNPVVATGTRWAHYSYKWINGAHQIGLACTHHLHGGLTPIHIDGQPTHKAVIKKVDLSVLMPQVVHLFYDELLSSPIQRCRGAPFYMI